MDKTTEIGMSSLLDYQYMAYASREDEEVGGGENGKLDANLSPCSRVW